MKPSSVSQLKTPEQTSREPAARQSTAVVRMQRERPRRARAVAGTARARAHRARTGLEAAH
jgi:hypothetical protein